MTTYTVAMLDYLVIATSVDGDRTMMDRRLQDARDLGIEFDTDDLRMITGLTLYATEDEAEEAGAVVAIYAGLDMGWLQDAEGSMDYKAAGRPHK